MRTKANLGTHPIHPMLVDFPITFYTVSLVAFVVYNWINEDPFWYRLGYFCTMAGIGTAVLAAIPGLIDWTFGIPKGTAAKKRGLLHMALNISALVLFSISGYLLLGTWDNVPDGVGAPLFLSFVGVGLTMMAGYHGFEMIATHKMGVVLTPEEEIIEEKEEKKSIRDGRPLRPRPV